MARDLVLGRTDVGLAALDGDGLEALASDKAAGGDGVPVVGKGDAVVLLGFRIGGDGDLGRCHLKRVLAGGRRVVRVGGANLDGHLGDVLDGGHLGGPGSLAVGGVLDLGILGHAGRGGLAVTLAVVNALVVDAGDGHRVGRVLSVERLRAVQRIRERYRSRKVSVEIPAREGVGNAIDNLRFRESLRSHIRGLSLFAGAIVLGPHKRKKRAASVAYIVLSQSDALALD